MAAFSKILFPTDFSPSADNALPHAVRLAALEGGEVVVQHVVKSFFERNPHWTTVFDVRELQDATHRHVRSELARTLADVDSDNARIREVISEGHPASAIVELAKTEHADLIVMGPGKGVVTGQVVRMATCPVLTVASTEQKRPLRPISKVLVGTDLSKNSRKLIDFAFDVKKLTDCEIHLLHAIELPEVVYFGARQGYSSEAADKLAAWSEDQMKNLTPHQALGDPSIHRHILEGSAVERIISMNTANAFDMVIIGTHEAGLVEKYFVSSTTERLINRLEAPILTMKI